MKNEILKIRFVKLKKLFVIGFIFSLNSLSINSTPTQREIDESYEKIEKISEIIFENHNLDIENRSLNTGYYGYKFEYKDDCKVILKLMNYSKKEYFFNVDFCKEKSSFFKIINHQILLN